MNRLSNIAAFIRKWDESNHTNAINTPSFKESSLKNINYTGDSTSDAAVIFTKNDSQFYSAIEPGVKPLVAILVEKFNWITFSSCSGHFSFQKHAYKKRMVQLLPRSMIEATKISTIFTKASFSSNAELACKANPIRMDVIEEELTSDNDTIYKSIKLIFDGGNIIEQEYFSHIEDATKLLCEQLTKSF